VQASVTTAQQLAAKLLTVSLHVTRHSGPALYALLERHCLTLSHVKALHELALHDDVPVKALAEQLGLSLPGMSRALDALVDRGIVQRREDPADRRVKRVHLTPSGRELLAQLDAARLAGLEQFAAELGAEERDALAAALAPIVDRLGSR
jgi:DNA-binding MarR family transcriptional regulator